MKNFIVNRLRMSLVVPLSLLLPLSLSAADPTTVPSTKPAAPKPTTEQAALINKIREEPLDEPIPKYDQRLVDATGAPNANFGKLDQHFIAHHEALLKRAKAGPIDLLFLGDSITEGWQWHGTQIWAERYARLNAANFGVSGDRTEHVLWRIANGELDGISPKVVVLMLGTNNMGSTPEKIAAGDIKVIAQIHQKLPQTKVLLLAIFPRGANPGKDHNDLAIRKKVEATNAILAAQDDGKMVRYLDIDSKLLTADGLISKQIMPDAVHPSTLGYQIWADAMQPLLDEMMK
jgi:lysophospholipase L1-like esterase